MPNPILDALIQYLATPQNNQSNMAMNPNPAQGARPLPQPPQQGVGVTYSQPGQGNPFGATFYPQQVDLGRIPVNPNQQAFAPQQEPSLPKGATPPTFPQEQSTSPRQPSPIMEFLRQMGIPLASAVAGVANPNLLPGTAGLATGYSEEMSNQREQERKLAIAKEGVPTYTFDPDTGTYEDTGVRIPKNAKTRNLTSEQQIKLRDALDKILKEPSKSTEEITSEVKSKYKIGESINRGGSDYKVVGFDKDGEPLVEKTK